MVDDTLLVLLNNRCFLYSYLQQAFAKEPDLHFLASAADDHTEEECALLDDELEEGSTLQKEIAHIASLALKDDAVAATLKDEYTKLMIGPGTLPAPPWESVYICGDTLLFQESTLRAREAYRLAGLKAAEYPHEADDHLAIELSYMFALAQRTLEAYQADDEAETTKELIALQSDFLSAHLNKWLSAFCERLCSASGISAFYPSFAELVQLVCRRDAILLDEMKSRL